jgi:aspartate/methionine/tyrosine aminotransferase
MRDFEFDATSSTSLEAYLAQTLTGARHDLTSSYSDVLDLSILQNLADADDFEAWERLDFGYTGPDGSEKLRSRVAQLYSTVSDLQIVCCTGAHDAATCVADALLTREDHAIVILPLYQPLEWTITDRVDATGISLDAAGLRLDLDKVEAAITPRTRAILMNFPNSPTGVVLDDDTLNGLVTLCRRHRLWLINDEVYRHLLSGRTAAPIVDAYERGISIDALTKGYGLPGLRVGWVACRNAELLRRISRAKARRSSFVAAPSDALAAIALASRSSTLDHARRICTEHRTALRRSLQAFPELFEPELGHNLLFACPRYLGPDGAAAFANRLLTGTGTVVLPTSLWQSQLAPIPQDRIRIGLGLRGSGEGLEVLANYLFTHRFVDA